MKSLEQKLNPDNAFAAWRGYLARAGSEKYLYGARKEHIEQLISIFKEAGVEYDDALCYKQKVMEALVTEEGRRGKDRHKGWKENVLNDFIDLVNYAYIEQPSQPTPTTKPLTLELHPEVMSWVKQKFGRSVNDVIIQDAHTIGHSLHLLFMNEFYNRKPRSK